MKKVILLLLLILPLTVQAQEKISLPEIGISLPGKIGKFSYESRNDYGGDLGYSVTYGQRMGRITIYVYSNGIDEIKNGTKSSEVREELSKSMNELYEYERTGKIRDLKKMELDIDLKNAIGGKFVVAPWFFNIEGGGCKSFTMVRGEGGYFVKVRATMFILDEKWEQNSLADFMKELGKKMSEDPPGEVKNGK